ncbi:SulP family inorganic anion transporter [Alienimonas californiensis]|uniref:C4-dicarboxylic acid transporter DauA n=1 Tax=Alienimonas californiensis TaxID=2527989 RepID=A0A517PDZ1_9PLAN|nr:SulP family inorganic anion transporter [Alienimonas californiensis]QDT17593.1 C4-dicarboxylic acid transporter DauA [Alienimonas californiensis]
MLQFFRQRQRSIKDDTLSGLTVALALVPEAVAFAFLAGVEPIIALYSAFFLCLGAAVLGGRPGMISGATGAMAVVVIGLVRIHGIEYLFPTVILCGLIQIAVGAARLGLLIRIVPHSVMLGFVNGLAIVILLAQFGSFQTVNAAGEMVLLRGPAMGIMLGLIGLTMLIIWGLPKLTRAVPSSLAAILTVSLVAAGLNQWADRGLVAEGQSNVVPTVGDMLATNKKAFEANKARVLLEEEREADADAELDPALVQAAVASALTAVDEDPNSRSIAGGLPRLFFLEWELPPVSWETLWIILPFSLTLAGVGLIESLMTLALIDEITETRGQSNRECFGQGASNVVCGLFGGMGGCAMIGQSLINVNSGGRGRLSGIVAAGALLAFVLFLAPWIQMIPMPALVGVMFMVVIGTFEWASLKMFRRMPTIDVFVMLLVAGYTVVMHDLASAVVLGVIVSALAFAWTHATHLGADIKLNEHGSKIYQLHGPLFFASVASFKELFSPREDPDDVVVDFYYTRVYDQSGLEAINSLAEKYTALGKRLHLTHLSPECRKLLDRAGELVEVNVSEDPQYHVATDRFSRLGK